MLTSKIMITCNIIFRQKGEAIKPKELMVFFE